MTYEIRIKSSFRSKQLLSITKYDVLNFIFTYSWNLQLWGFQEWVCQFTTYGKSLVCLVFV